MSREFFWAVPMGKLNLALAICLLSQGCALVQNEQAIDASSSLIGRRRAAIMECAGIPDKVEQAGDKEIDMYSAAARHFASGVVLGEANCTVSIAFEADRVFSVNYMAENPGVLAPLESCAEIVAACLR
jgi:hypothetical protein